jgi:hypothetical protein
VIRRGDWGGFVTRNAEGRFEQCVLYNRTIEALNASPANMIGLARDAAGRVGLQVFFEPRTLVRADRIAIALGIDQRPPISIAGQAVSDFHAVTTAGLDAATLTALRSATTLDVTVDKRTLRVKLDDIGGVLDALRDCVAANAG